MIDDRITAWHFEGLPNPGNSNFQYQQDGATSATVSDPSAHKKIILDFEKVSKQGGKPIASGKSAKATTELIFAIYQSVLM